jgi:hypothetical protein
VQVKAKTAREDKLIADGLMLSVSHLVQCKKIVFIMPSKSNIVLYFYKTALGNGGM